MVGRFFIIMLFGYVLVLVGCASNSETPTQIESTIAPKTVQENTVVARPIGIDPIVYLTATIPTEFLVEKWHHSLRQDNIVNLYVCDNWLLVETKEYNLYALDRKTGVPTWMFAMGSSLDFQPGIYKNKADSNKDRIYLLNQARLQILDKNTGSLLCKKDLSFVPCSPVSVGENFVYIGAWDNFIYALDKETGEQEWRYRIDGYVYGEASIMDNVLLFAGTDQNVYSIWAENGNSVKTWANTGRFSTRGPNVSGVVAQENPAMVYMGSRDYNLYCLHRNDGSLRWKFETGGEIKRTPHVVGNTIYAMADTYDNTSIFYAVASDGQERWQMTNGIWILFLGKQYDWVVKNDKTIACVKSETNQIETTFDFSRFDIFACNLHDNMGYFATHDGHIFAVEEK